MPGIKMYLFDMKKKNMIQRFRYILHSLPTSDQWCLLSRSAMDSSTNIQYFRATCIPSTHIHSSAKVLGLRLRKAPGKPEEML